MSEVVVDTAVPSTETPQKEEVTVATDAAVESQETPATVQDKSDTVDAPAEVADTTVLATPLEKVSPAEPAMPEADVPAVEAPEVAAPEPETAVEQEVTAQEPIFEGILAYRKGTATLPFWHRRWFYFTKEATPLDRLHAFYAKYKLKVEKDELNHVVAHAATSGTGLFFLSKSQDAVPSGILECSRIEEVKADAHSEDRFALSYGAKQVFYFETGADSRDAWIAGITKMKKESEEGLEALQSSPAYLAVLKSLEDGTAFKKTDAPTGAADVLSEDEATAVTSEAVSASTTEVAEPVKAKSKRMSFLNSISDELARDEPKSAEKLAKKEKRKSFLSGFISKKDLSALKSTEIVPEPAKPEDEQAGEVLDKQLSTVTEAAPEAAEPTEVVEPEAEESKPSPSKASVAPLKSRMDSFMQKVKKIGDHASKKTDAETVETSEAPETLPVSAQDLESTVETVKDAVLASAESSSPAVLENVTDVSSTPVESSVVEPTSTANEPAAAVVTEETDEVPAEIKTTPEKRPGLARKLTSLFRGRKLNRADTTTTSTVTAEPPQLPEPAKIELDTPESQTTDVNLEQTAGSTVPTPVAVQATA